MKIARTATLGRAQMLYRVKKQTHEVEQNREGPRDQYCCSLTRFLNFVKMIIYLARKFLKS